MATNTKSYRSSLAVVLLALLSQAHAQQVSPNSVKKENERPTPNVTTSRPNSAELDEAIELSPFVVSAENDSGYQAGTSLSGNRLRTNLADTPASVSVFTEEFMKDLGATNLAGVIEYSPNANVDFNSVSSSASFAFYDGAALNDIRVNVRGLATSTRATDFLPTLMPLDIYNTGRFDLSSGPNAALFGLAEAGGIVNTSTKLADVNRSFVKVNVAGGSFGTLRADEDINVSDRKKRFGLRVMSVHDKSDTWRRFGDRKTDRYTVGFTIKPFASTSISGSYEDAHFEDPNTRPYNRGDNVSMWILRGSPIVDNTTISTNAGAALSAFGVRGIGNRLVYNQNDASPIFAARAGQQTFVFESAGRYGTGMDSTLLPQFQEGANFNANVTLLPFSPTAGSSVPYEPLDINYYGPDLRRTNDITRAYARVEQKIGKSGYLEIGFIQEELKGASNNYAGNYVLDADPNRFVPNPNGTASSILNPRAGQYYTEILNQRSTADSKNQAMRATGTWTFRLGNFGDHLLAALAERATIETQNGQSIEALFNATTNLPAFNAQPENGVNQLFRRYYVTADPVTHVPAPLPAGGSRITYGGQEYYTRYVGNANLNGAKQTTDTLLLATQSEFFKSRLVFTGALRHDKLENTPLLVARTTATDPRVISGELALNENAFQGENNAAAARYSIDTYSAGAVFKVTPWLRVFYNQSTNAGLPQTVRRMLPDARFPVTPTGEGSDYGIMLNLLDGKVFARATAFTTESQNDPTIRDNTFINAHRRILDAYFRNGLMSQAEVDSHSVVGYLGDFYSDISSEGYEFEMKVNLTKNWALTAAYSYTDLKRTGLGTRDWYPWFDAEKPLYDRFSKDLLTQANIPISQEIADIENGVDQLFSINEIGYNNRPHKANVFTRYTFTGGRAKGFFVGGGVRWQDRNIVQRRVIGIDPRTNKDILGSVMRGPEIFNVDALAGYSTRIKSGLFGRATTIRVQLNVTNVLDSDDFQVVRFNRVGDGFWRVVARDPRTFRFSTSLEF